MISFCLASFLVLNSYIWIWACQALLAAQGVVVVVVVVLSTVQFHDFMNLFIAIMLLGQVINTIIG